MARKNPIGAIEAFRRAFNADPTKHLAIKVGHLSSAPQQQAELERALADCNNISLHDLTLPPGCQQDWIGCCDALISLHRSEGFGLVMAEAMQIGIPVIATNWSGNIDFMNSQNAALVDFKLVQVRDPQGIYLGPGQLWADPDLDHAAAWLQKVASSTELRRRLGQQAMTDVNASLSAVKYCDRLLDFVKTDPAFGLTINQNKS